MPLISVIIPTYNRRDSISKAINSVLNQTISNWELIIVDDGSEDDTKEVIDFFLNDNRIKYFRQENKGVSAARNTGAFYSNGEYLTFLDSDDEVTTNWLFDFYEAFSNNEKAYLILGGLQIVRPDKSIIISPARKNKYNVPIPGTFLIKKTLLVELGLFDEKLKYAENTELFFRLEKKSIKPFIIATSNLIYHDSLDGGSKNLKNIIESTQIILEKHNRFLSKRIKHLYEQIVGVNYLRIGNYPFASQHLWKAFILNPLSLKTFLRFILSRIPVLAKKFYPIIDT